MIITPNAKGVGNKYTVQLAAYNLAENSTLINGINQISKKQFYAPTI